MSIATRVRAYLNTHNIGYETIIHNHSHCSMETARAAGIKPEQTAKAVMLEDHQGHHLMAVLPASHKISLDRLGQQFQAEWHLIEEERLTPMFEDCEPGAVPSLGAAYNLNTIYDDALGSQSEIYMESGDHTTLIRLRAEDFAELVRRGQHGHFSNKAYH
ncbi:aminoacyl-tRNA deacylase [Motiliproteus sp.]|uniref:aminoacyl-tRNA deacylase n=1 Tax=Motiliproteus sp. TaxID=1898955 RepID=UPI003BAB8B17